MDVSQLGTWQGTKELTCHRCLRLTELQRDRKRLKAEVGLLQEEVQRLRADRLSPAVQPVPAWLAKADPKAFEDELLPEPGTAEFDRALPAELERVAEHLGLDPAWLAGALRGWFPTAEAARRAQQQRPTSLD